MNTLLRMLVEWQARRRAAQVIVLDGGAEVERVRAFARGTVVGAGLTLGVFLLTAPSSGDPDLLSRFEQREVLLLDANRRAELAMSVANVCLSTAQSMERTLAGYQTALSGRALGPAGPGARR